MTTEAHGREVDGFATLFIVCPSECSATANNAKRWGNRPAACGELKILGAALQADGETRSVMLSVRRCRFGVPVNRTQFAFRMTAGTATVIRSWIMSPGTEDLMVAMAACEAACRHWPGETTTLRQGARVIEDSRKAELA
jgi:hypothetical protein